MLTSLALIFIVGMALGSIVTRLRLPSLLGMRVTGILLGPYVLDLLDDSILGISAALQAGLYQPNRFLCGNVRRNHSHPAVDQ